MPDCIICYEKGAHQFNGDYRPDACDCKYEIHESCYQTWLSSTNMAFNCIICHNSTTWGQAATLRSINENNENNYKHIYNIVYLIFAILIIQFYKEIIAVSLFTICLLSYYTRLQQQQQQQQQQNRRVLF